MKNISLLVLSCIYLSLNAMGQEWTSVQQSELMSTTNEDPQIRASEASYYDLNFDVCYDELLQVQNGETVILPMPNGDFQEFSLEENNAMAEGLRQNYPGIRTFNAMSMESGSIWGKVEISHKGLRAMIFSPGKSTVFIDPVFKSSPQNYIVYHQNKFVTDKSFECHIGSVELDSRTDESKMGEPYNACELKTYEIAIAGTGTYTEFHGGNVEDALAAMATSMDRINGIYERDFGITFTIVEDNDQIIYTDSGSDPYTSGNTGAMIGEVQENIDQEIGNDNYDIGHVFDGTNAGGLASLGVVCAQGSKARGVTTGSSPVNDPFDLRVLSHEIGHQFSATHTFNNACGGNRTDATAVEPGSGTTPMSYAAICPPNVQNFTDEHFHGISMEQIGLYIDNPLVTCQTTSEIMNTAPVLEDLPDLVFIPASTPFSLAANATDFDDDVLTYCWEQMDNEITSQPPVSNASGGPNFRSLPPVEDSVRYFPSLASIVSGGPFTWERIPTVERQMNFRVTVRDNAPGAGCAQYDDMTIQTVGEAGPFEVLYPSDFGIVWQPFTEETILWDVANTDASPINAETVNIWLSTNNGFGFQFLLAEDVPNTGSFTLEVPNIPTTIAKIMIQNSEGTFFDVSNSNFDIIGFENGFFFSTDFQGAEICPDESFSFDIDLVEIGEYSETIDLTISSQPENSDISLSVNQASVGESLTVTASNFTSTPPGEYTLTISGAGGDFDNDISFTIGVLNDSPIAPAPEFPDDGAGAVPTNVTLQWEELNEPGTIYNIELASDQEFSDIVASAIDLEGVVFEVTGLEPETEYFWRVSKENACGASEFSEVFSFTTFTCLDESPDDLPLEIDDGSPDFYSSELFVDQDGLIADIDVIGLEGEHERVSELIFRLEGPDGTIATLGSNLCGLNLTLEPGGDLVVNSPASIAGSFESSGAVDWSAPIPSSGVTAQGVQPEDAGADGDIHDLCQFALNPEQLEGNIALINRSPEEEGCDFVTQIFNAQDAGAAAAVVINNVPGEGFFDMPGSANNIDIPAVMISFEDGQTILSGIAEDVQDFNLSFDDDAVLENIPCPPTDGEAYKPQDPLSVFTGTNAQGDWKLEIEDTQDENGGELLTWGLRICYADDIMSTYEPAASQVILFPNPTNGSLFVEIGELNAERALLMDLSGRVLESKAIQNTRLEFNLSRYSNGLYFVRLEGNGVNTTYKVVKGE